MKYVCINDIDLTNLLEYSKIYDVVCKLNKLSPYLVIINDLGIEQQIYKSRFINLDL